MTAATAIARPSVGRRRSGLHWASLYGLSFDAGPRLRVAGRRARRPSGLDLLAAGRLLGRGVAVGRRAGEVSFTPSVASWPGPVVTDALAAHAHAAGGPLGPGRVRGRVADVGVLLVSAHGGAVPDVRPGTPPRGVDVLVAAVVGLGRLGVGVLALLEDLLERVGRLLDGRVVLRAEVGGDVVVLLGQRVRRRPGSARRARSAARAARPRSPVWVGLSSLIDLSRVLGSRTSCTAARRRSMMPCSTCSSCGTTGSGSASSGNHRRSAHFAGSTIRGSPDHDRAVKKKSIRSSIGSPPRVRCIEVTNARCQVGDVDLLEGLAPRGVVRRLALLDVPGGRGRPVVVHVAGVLPQLQQHLRSAVDAVAQQEDVRRAGTTTNRSSTSGGRRGQAEGRRRSSSEPRSRWRPSSTPGRPWPARRRRRSGRRTCRRSCRRRRRRPCRCRPRPCPRCRRRGPRACPWPGSAFPWRRRGSPCLLLRWCEVPMTPRVATLATCRDPRPRSRSWPSSGATASGKTGLSLDLAERLGGEVVNTDAMQVYRGMDVGTAKLPEAERRGIPHHLLDTLTVREPATVAEFQGWARDGDRPAPRRAVRRRCWSAARRSTPARSSTGSSSRAPTTTSAPGWEQELAERGPQALHAVLAERDPDAAARILPENGRRIVRALEVVELTGRPFSASLPTLEYADPHTVQIGVDIDRETLDRADRRAGRRDVRQRLRRGGPPPARPRPGRGPHRAPGDRLPRGGRAPARRAHRGGGPRADRARPPGGSPAARTRGSARTRASSGSGTTTRELVDKALAAVAAGSEQDRSGATPRLRPDWRHERGVQRPRPAARAAGRGARRGQPHPRRHGGRRLLLAVPLQPPALPQRRRAAGRDEAPGDAGARGLAAAPGRLGHRHRFAAGYESVEGFSRAFARAFGHPPSAPQGRAARHWLPAPNGIHFHPPISLWVEHAKEQHR